MMRFRGATGRICLRLIVLVLVNPLFSRFAEAQVWTHLPERQWSEEWENKFSAWIETEVDTDWLQKRDLPFAHWPVDCAKLLYLTRLYFSYINALEFSIRAPETAAGKISSRETRWNNRIGEERLQEFAKYILSRVNTSTLVRDTVLIPLSPSYVKPGVILLGDRKRGHAWLIKKINLSGIPELLHSTLPPSEFIYRSFVFPPPQSAFPLERLPSQESGGLRRFRHPDDLLKPAREIDYASNEQSDKTKTNFESFFSDLQDRIQIRPRTPDEEFGYTLDTLCMKVRERVNIIIDAGHAVEKARGRKFSSHEDELYSTPKRDRDIRLAIESVDDFYLRARSLISENNQRRYRSLISPQGSRTEECPVTWADNRIEPLRRIRQRFLLDLISSVADDSFRRRWGEVRCSGNQAQSVNEREYCRWLESDRR